MPPHRASSWTSVFSVFPTICFGFQVMSVEACVGAGCCADALLPRESVALSGRKLRTRHSTGRAVSWRLCVSVGIWAQECIVIELGNPPPPQHQRHICWVWGRCGDLEFVPAGGSCQVPWRGKSLPQEAYRPGGLAGIQWPCGRVHGAETEFLMRCHGVRRGSVCGI